MGKRSKVVVGVDQSYTRTGITVLQDGRLREIFSVSVKGTNTEKRKAVCDELRRIFRKYSHANVFVIYERIRLYSKGKISENYIRAISALCASIVDAAAEFHIPVYSVDTRAWKTAIVGTSRPLENPYGINPEKYRALLYMRDNGLLKYIAEPYTGKGKKGVIPVVIQGKTENCKLNDDIADSYCIAKYGFLPEKRQKLQEETF